MKNVSIGDLEVSVMYNCLVFGIKRKVNVVFYIMQYPVRWTAQSALHFLPSLTDLFIPTPIRLLREAF